MNNTTVLMNKNFILVVIGQIISLFGNTMLRFALPLYILKQTGSTAVFGTILAISMIPTIVLSPFGGMLADRVSKKWIMVILDVITAISIFLFSTILSDKGNITILITIMLIILSIIQSFYQPAVQASIPLIVPKKDILQGNAIVSLVNSLASLLGPVLGGIFYATFGLIPLVMVSAVCFLFAAIMEFFIQIAFVAQERTTGMFSSIVSDFKLSMNFITKKKPVLFKMILIAAGINLVLSALILVGYPTFIMMHLKLGEQMYGIAQGAIAAGSIAGGILVGVIAQKVLLKYFYLVLVQASIFIIPMSLPFIFEMDSMISFIILVISGFMIMACATLFSIRLMSFMQEQTPEHLLAKVISYILTICMCALPLGQVVYGNLFKVFSNNLYIVILGAAFFSIVISLSAKNSFKTLE